MTTKEEFANMLNGRQYDKGMTREEKKLAKDSGLVVAIGASDDLLDLYGAINDEIPAFQGVEANFTSKGVYIEWMDKTEIKNLVSKGWTPPSTAFTIKAEWCPKNLDTSWRITSSLPYASFDIMEDDELFCRGCVFNLPSAEND